MSTLDREMRPGYEWKEQAGAGFEIARVGRPRETRRGILAGESRVRYSEMGHQIIDPKHGTRASS